MKISNLKIRFKKYITERKAIHLNDSFATYKKWEELIKLLSENENDTINLIQNSTKEEIDLISEVMEDVAEKLDSKAYIDALKSVSKKYPECNLEDIIEISVKHMKNKYET